MWTITLNVILKRKKDSYLVVGNAGSADLPETVKSEIVEILEKHLEKGDLDDYAVEIEF